MKKRKLTRTERMGILVLISLHLAALAGVTTTAAGMTVGSDAAFWTGMAVTGSTGSIMIAWAVLYIILTRKLRREEEWNENVREFYPNR